MIVTWTVPSIGNWYSLTSTNFSNVIVTGVYLIWHAGSPGQSGRWVKVGQGKTGNVGSRLTAHKADPAIVTYQRYGELYATWATVPTDQVDGVERFLGDHLKPLVGDRFPDATPIPVNIPA